MPDSGLIFLLIISVINLVVSALYLLDLRTWLSSPILCYQPQDLESPQERLFTTLTLFTSDLQPLTASLENILPLKSYTLAFCTMIKPSISHSIVFPPC